MKFKRYLAGFALAAGIPMSASAAIVTLDGEWFDVKYDDAIVGMWGTPVLVGNELKFFPTQFKANSVTTTGTNAQDFEASTIALSIIAEDGYFISGADLAEGGDYFKFGGARSNVTVSGELRITSTSGPGGTVVDGIDSTPSFPFAATSPFISSPWTAAASVDLGGQATSANVTIQNLLAAWSFNDTSGAGTFQGAFVEKKNVILSVGVAPIPEPATWAMMATGGILLGFGLRRSRS